MTNPKMVEDDNKTREQQLIEAFFDAANRYHVYHDVPFHEGVSLTAGWLFEFIVANMNDGFVTDLIDDLGDVGQ